MTYIHFIVNPISGNAKGTHLLNADYINSFFPSTAYRIEVHYTKSKGHAMDLSRAAVDLNADIIVACGGDGTINEVASAMIGTGKKLGIVPIGSGNGLASHLGIPRETEKAIGIIRDNYVKIIDAGKINDHYFFSNTGTGFDAMVIKQYESSGTRTLWSYIKASLAASIKFRIKKAILTIEEDQLEIKPFMLFISNSNEMGYNMSLTPNASLNDGLLDVVIIPKLSCFKKLLLGWHVIRNTPEKFSMARHYRVKSLRVEYPEKIFMDAQIDGEYYYLKTNAFNIYVIPNGLNVLVRK